MTTGPRSSSAGVGSKATKMVYTDDPNVGKTTEFVDTEEDERRLLSLTDAEVEELARHALTIEEHYGRPMDIEWGKDGLDGELYVLQARPETVMSRRRRAPAVPDGREGRGRRRGPRHRPEDRCRRGARDDLDRGDARVQRGRGAGRGHDRPRLGADHEARLRDRHQPRRPHLPRGDHRPRARHPRGGRHGRRDPMRWRTAARSPSPAPRATRATSTTASWTSPSRRPSSRRCRRSAPRS